MQKEGADNTLPSKTERSSLPKSVIKTRPRLWENITLSSTIVMEVRENDNRKCKHTFPF